jgi:hypothetical protein
MIIGKYEATIYPEGDGWTGAISLGFDAAGRRHRVKRKGRTKAQVKDKLREVVEDLAAGVTAAEGYPVADAISDFLDQGMKGKSAETVGNSAGHCERQHCGLVSAGSPGQPAAITQGG